MNQRGMALWDIIIGLIVTIILVLVVLPLLFHGFLYFGTGERESYQNFEELATLLNKPMLEGKNYLPIKDWPYYISNDFILVGFNNDDLGSRDACDPEIVPRPRNNECLSSACLCLYKEQSGDIDFKDNLPVECQRIKDVDYIISLDYWQNGNHPYSDREEIYKNIIGQRFPDLNSKYYKDVYAYFFIYGQCEDFGLFDGDVTFGPQKLYVEKVYDPDLKKTIVFIADSDVEERYMKRLQAIASGTEATI